MGGTIEPATRREPAGQTAAGLGGDPALTIQLIDAFIKAGKDIDMLVLPNANHAFADLGLRGHDTHSDSPNNLFFLRKRWDYFVRLLLGAERPEGYVIQAGIR